MRDSGFKPLSRRMAEIDRKETTMPEYHTVPPTFINRFIQEINNALGTSYTISKYYSQIEKQYILLKGIRSLGVTGDSQIDVERYLQNSETEDCLDLVETMMRAFWLRHQSNTLNTLYFEAIENINYWLRYDNLGYEFNNGLLIRIDNLELHKEIIKPAFLLLSDPRFSGANEEMQKAFEFRRNRDNKNAIAEANKAFESTMKSICIIKEYSHEPTATAKTLLGVLRDNRYFPSYLDNHIDGIKNTLESGLPTVRNKNAGHGQGDRVVSVPDSYVDYALNLLATNIIFLVGLLKSE